MPGDREIVESSVRWGSRRMAKETDFITGYKFKPPNGFARKSLKAEFCSKFNNIYHYVIQYPRDSLLRSLVWYCSNIRTWWVFEWPLNHLDQRDMLTFLLRMAAEVLRVEMVHITRETSQGEREKEVWLSPVDRFIHRWLWWRPPHPSQPCSCCCCLVGGLRWSLNVLENNSLDKY